MREEPLIWPRMDDSEAAKRLEKLDEESGPPPDLAVDRFSFTGVGRRASSSERERLRNAIVDIATDHGFRLRRGFDQDDDPGPAGRNAFDTAVFQRLPELMPMNWAEAGSRAVWSWCAIALLPDVTHWRWKWVRAKVNWNRERWIGSDLTRHTYARQWWRSVQLADDPVLVDSLLEGDFNQITERANTIGANPHLIAVLARRLIDRAGDEEMARRKLVRDSTQRLLREMYFVEDTALSVPELTAWIDRIIETSVQELERATVTERPEA